MMVTTTQRTSPILCLPGEVRNQIVSEAFSGKTIHVRVRLISRPPPFSISQLKLYWDGWVCYPTQLDSDSMSKHPLLKDALDGQCRDHPHRPPSTYPFRDGHDPTAAPRCLSTRLGVWGWLVACRQTYDETVGILYGTNTFHFDFPLPKAVTSGKGPGLGADFPFAVRWSIRVLAFLSGWPWDPHLEAVLAHRQTELEKVMCSPSSPFRHVTSLMLRESSLEAPLDFPAMFPNLRRLFFCVWLEIPRTDWRRAWPALNSYALSGPQSRPADWNVFPDDRKFHVVMDRLSALVRRLGPKMAEVKLQIELGCPDERASYGSFTIEYLRRDQLPPEIFTVLEKQARRMWLCMGSQGPMPPFPLDPVGGHWVRQIKMHYSDSSQRGLRSERRCVDPSLGSWP